MKCSLDWIEMGFYIVYTHTHTNSLILKMGNAQYSQYVNNGSVTRNFYLLLLVSSFFFFPCSLCWVLFRFAKLFDHSFRPINCFNLVAMRISALGMKCLNEENDEFSEVNRLIINIRLLNIYLSQDVFSWASSKSFW